MTAQAGIPRALVLSTDLYLYRKGIKNSVSSFSLVSQCQAKSNSYTIESNRLSEITFTIVEQKYGRWSVTNAETNLFSPLILRPKHFYQLCQECPLLYSQAILFYVTKRRFQNGVQVIYNPC